MPQTDRFDRMNTTQLEDEATQRGLDLSEFQQLASNKERAQRLRDHDSAQQADADVAQRNAEEAARRQQQQDPGADQGQATEEIQVDRGDSSARDRQDVGDADVAPYANPESLENAQAAASGRVVTEESIDTSKAPQVGGQNEPTVQGRDQQLDRDDQRADES